jgi:pyruvate/2-oxoglutarate dehydrogenase complex dihydrolipoamide acyltransferase (E2) component
MVDVPVMKDGAVALEKNIPLGIVCDERICSGSYYGRAFRMLKKYMEDPRLLEVPPEKVEEDF